MVGSASRALRVVLELFAGPHAEEAVSFAAAGKVATG